MCRVTPPGYVHEYGDTSAMRITAAYRPSRQLGIAAHVRGHAGEHEDAEDQQDRARVVGQRADDRRRQPAGERGAPRRRSAQRRVDALAVAHGVGGREHARATVTNGIAPVLRTLKASV